LGCTNHHSLILSLVSIIIQVIFPWHLKIYYPLVINYLCGGIELVITDHIQDHENLKLLIHCMETTLRQLIDQGGKDLS